MSKAKLLLPLILGIAVLYLSHGGGARVHASSAWETPNPAPKPAPAPSADPAPEAMPNPSAHPTPTYDDDDDSDASQRLQESETIRKSFNLTAAHKALEVDTIFGSIDVVGGQ